MSIAAKKNQVMWDIMLKLHLLLLVPGDNDLFRMVCLLKDFKCGFHDKENPLDPSQIIKALIEHYICVSCLCKEQKIYKTNGASWKA